MAAGKLFRIPLGGRAEERGNAASKPAERRNLVDVESKPAALAEKKNARDAAPVKSMRGAIEVWCAADG